MIAYGEWCHWIYGLQRRRFHSRTYYGAQSLSFVQQNFI